MGPIASVATVGILGGFLTFFLLSDGDRGWAWLMGPLAGWRAEMVTESARTGLERVGGYLLRTAVLAAVDALVVWAAMVVLGVPLAGPLAVLVLLAGFVPYLGAILAFAVVLLVTLAAAGPAASAGVLVAIVLAAIGAPRALGDSALGDRADVHPIVVLAAIPAGAALFGLLGLVALLPLTVFALGVVPSLIVALDLGPAEPAPGEIRASRDALGSDPRDVPVWLDRLGQWSWRGLVVVGLLAALVAVAVRVPTVVVPGVIAIVLAATLAPLVARLQRSGWSPGAAATVMAAGATVVAAVLNSLFGIVVAMVLALLLTLFFLRDGAAWFARLVGRLHGVRRDRVQVVGETSVEVLGGYMIGTAAISAFGGVTSGLILAILGLPLAVPVGVLSFFGGFIPYIGSFLTTAMALLVAIAVGTTSDVIVMAVYTVVFNVVQGNFVTPLVYGRTLSLHPAVILLAIPAGNEVAGILGMFLVVPFVAVVAATWRALLEVIEPHDDDATAPGDAVSALGVGAPRAETGVPFSAAEPAPG